MGTGVVDVFKTLEASGYVVSCGRQQTMLFYDGKKVGGWNRRERHWYVSKVIVRGREALLEDHGFRWKEKPGHQWWQLDGEENVGAFVKAVRALTGTG